MEDSDGACSKRRKVVGGFVFDFFVLLDAVISFQTKQELPAICVFGLRPRFFLGI
jgi:hypothetical protein